MKLDPAGKSDPRIVSRPVPASKPRCPNCGWQDVRLSKSKGVMGLALAALSIAAFRCRSCGHRFHRFQRHLAAY